LLPISTTLFCDNTAIKLAIDNNYHARTKHIDIHFHFIRQVITDGTITLIYYPTDDMAADILTKSLPKWKVSTHVCTLRLHRVINTCSCVCVQLGPAPNCFTPTFLTVAHRFSTVLTLAPASRIPDSP
jgi:hypothetical protein